MFESMDIAISYSIILQWLKVAMASKSVRRQSRPLAIRSTHVLSNLKKGFKKLIVLLLNFRSNTERKRKTLQNGGLKQLKLILGVLAWSRFHPMLVVEPNWHVMYNRLQTAKSIDEITKTWNGILGLWNMSGPYQGGLWRIRVELPDAYLYKSRSIGFINKSTIQMLTKCELADAKHLAFWLDIFLFEFYNLSGSAFLDVINQTWSSMFDLINVVEVFLPQSVMYPNPSDPLNGEAAALMMHDAYCS
ncbi:hypothetical protein FEM48_Zijuj07G0053000 [Ziziphus jujuba var. spinosa]|uniref:UBC core domain-containing protein n=1 Tax=Ziziphus jujuba var. spinosa TaxID=714518 RepID=A0A978V2P3_ZIZJJ|nr:hypothetical protein FEM48_Zijuj07G0053000 [Ziziphus jujuba var. spinosa]